MSATAARVSQKRRRAFDRLPVEEQRKQRVEEARAFETARKPLIKRATSKVVGFFKKAVALVKRAAVVVANVVRAHWPHALAAVLFSVAVIVAPGTSLTAAAFVVAGYALARSESPFARFVAHVFFRTGVEIFAEGVVTAVGSRRE